MSPTQLLRSAPYLPVSDVGSLASYYQEVLGFTLDYSAGDPAEFAILSRDSLPVMLRLVAEPDLIRPNEKQGGTWDVFFWVRDARALHGELADRDADIVYGPVVQEAYGMEEFAVRDPQGHVLGFGQALG